MRGSPLLRAGLVLTALLLLSMPLLRLTHGAKAASSAVRGPVEKSNVHLELLSTRAPFHFEVLHLGKIVWQGESAGNKATTEIAMEFPKEGIDLELKGGWQQEESVAAVKLIVTPKDDIPREKSVWAERTFDEVLTFQ